MTFQSFKIFYVLSCILLCVIILWPTASSFVPFPEGERFSEIWVLGPNRVLGEFPFNVSSNFNYTIYLDVGNHMGGTQYYMAYVKIRNQSEPLPDTITGQPSPLSPVFEYRLFAQDGEIVEKRLDFSFTAVFFEGNMSRITKLLINGRDVIVDKYAVWDDYLNGYYYQFFFELWIYNLATSDFQFHNRYVQFWLNMSSQL